MLRDVNQHVARRIKELWERTGIFPVFRLPKSGPLLKWLHRHVLPFSSWEGIQTLAGRAWNMLGLPQHALVVTNVSLEAKHGSGLLMQASLTYASGALALKRAKEIAEALKDQGARVVPIDPGVNDGLLKAHLDRRENQVSDPEILTITTQGDGHQTTMKYFKLFPTKLTPKQLDGSEPLPDDVRFTVSSEDGRTPRRREPTLRYNPPIGASPVFG